VSDAGQRPTDRDYDRYLWLVEEAKRVRYNQGRLRECSSFRVGDAFFTAIFASASDHLAALADRLGSPEGAEAREQAEVARAAVQRRADRTTGLASDLDLRTGQDLVSQTVAGFAPLIAGSPSPSTLRNLSRLLQGPCWAGHPGFLWPLPPSISPCDSSFRRRSYWRGPVWPGDDLVTGLDAGRSRRTRHLCHSQRRHAFPPLPG
jgi:glucosylglycerate hydrolase